MVDIGFLFQGSYPAPGDFKPGVLVEAFLTRGHVDVEGFFDWQFFRVFGLVW